MMTTEAKGAWPASIAATCYRPELRHADCEAIARRMDSLYRRAPLAAHECAGLIYLYCVKLKECDGLLWKHKAGSFVVHEGEPESDPWDQRLTFPSLEVADRAIVVAQKVDRYVRYLESRYPVTAPSIHDETAAAKPVQRKSRQRTASIADDIVFCAKTSRQILPGQSPENVEQQGYSDPDVFGLTVDAERMREIEAASISTNVTFADIDEWARLEMLALRGRTKKEVAPAAEGYEPAPL